MISMPHGSRSRKGNARAVRPRRTRMTIPSEFSGALRDAIRELTQELMTEIAEDVGREMGRDLKSGQLEALGILGPETIPQSLQIQDSEDSTHPENSGSTDKIFDVFGQDVTNGLPLPPCCEFVECTNCHNKVASTRYSTHLAKCLFGLARIRSKPSKLREADEGEARDPIEEHLGVVSLTPKSVVKLEGKGQLRRQEEVPDMTPSTSESCSTSRKRRGARKQSTVEKLAKRLMGVAVTSPPAKIPEYDGIKKKQVKCEEASSPTGGATNVKPSRKRSARKRGVTKKESKDN